MNSTTGIAAAFSLKTIMTAVVSLGVAAVVAVGGYAVASNYILFPEFNEALANTLEAKSEPLTEFDTQKFQEEGKTEIKLGFGDEDFDTTVSLSHSEKALQAALSTCGETFTVSYKDLNVAVAADGFNDGEAYGISLKNLRDEIMDSIFAADSGTDYEIDMDVINQVCDVVEKITEPKETNKEYERAYEYLMKVFEKSEMAKDAQISYSKLEVLGEERSGRSQTLTINQDYLVKLLEDYATALDEAKGKDLEAIEYVLEDIESITESSIDLDDLVEVLEEAADTLEDIEALEDLEIKYSVCYVGKYLSAVVFSVEYKNKDMDADVSGVITVDFGAKPNKTNEIIFNVTLGGEVAEEKVEVVGEVVYDAVKDGDEITYSVEVIAEVDAPGMSTEISGKAELLLDCKNNEAILSASADVAGEKKDLFNAEFEFTDSKDKLSLSPEYIEVMGKGFDVPIDITVSFYRNPDKIKANKYEDLLDMSEKEFEDLLEDLEDYTKDLVENFAGFEDVFGDLGDLGNLGDLGDLGGMGGMGGIAVPDYDYDDDYDDDDNVNYPIYTPGYDG